MPVVAEEEVAALHHHPPRLTNLMLPSVPRVAISSAVPPVLTTAVIPF